MQPTLAGFIAWSRTAMGVPAGACPDDSVWFVYAYAVSIDTVNLNIQAASPVAYMLAVYNLAGDNLINWAQDTPPSTYFTALRSKEVYNISNFAPGVVSSASDSSTSTSLTVLDVFKDMTLANLQNLKTPYGRAYLGIAQSYGTPWGIS